MQNSLMGIAGPLGRLAEVEVEQLLRGFPDNAISGALKLREGFETEDLDNCLIGILGFYLPMGTKLSESGVSSESRLRDDLGLDSLALSEAMFKVEELFDIRVENTEIVEIETVADARRLLMEKLETSLCPA